MADFEPLAIADISAGLFTARDSLVAPKDTWRTLSNLRVQRGRLVVRGGYVLLGKLYPQVRQQVIAGSAGTTVISGTLSQLPVHPGESAPSTYRVTFWDGGVGAPSGKIVQDNGAGVITGASLVGTGTINYATGAFTFTYSSNATNNVRVNFEWERGLAVTGVFDHFEQNGTERFVATDTKRLYLWDAIELRFEDLLGADLFTGGEFNYFWFTPFEDDLLLVNGVNPIYLYDPGAGTVTELATEFDSGSGGNDLDTCQLLIRHRGRVVALNTTENGASRPQRARRSNINNPSAWTSADYSDAPTNQRILSAGVVGDSIVVFFDGGETWLHRYTGEVILGQERAPYEWVKLASFRGGAGRLGTAPIEGGVVTVSPHGLVATDGRSVQEIDGEIEDYHLLMQTDELEKSFVVNDVQHDEVLLSHVRAGYTAPNRILVWNYREQAFYEWPLSFRVFHYYRNTASFTWDTSGAATWEAQPVGFPTTWDKTSGQSGFPILVAGDGAGGVYAFSGVGTDAGGDISFSARTQKINPFEGQNARLGFVDVIADAVAGKTVTLRFYRDFRSASYYAATIDLTPLNSGDTKVRRRVRVNQISQTHTVQIEGTGLPAEWGLDALILWLAPSGKASTV